MAARKPAPAANLSVVTQTEKALNAAVHLTDMDAGAVAVLRNLARSVDWLLSHDGMSEHGKFDNVSVPTYLRYCEQLGLTPTGRKALAMTKEGPAGGKLGKLRSVHQDSRSA